jgi:hypothetical protein
MLYITAYIIKISYKNRENVVLSTMFRNYGGPVVQIRRTKAGEYKKYDYQESIPN